MTTSRWRKVALSEIAEVRLGRQRSPKRAVGPNMRPYMRAANVKWNGISLHDVKQMDFTPQEFETYALQRGDLLLSEASGSASEVGKPAVWNDEVANCCFQNTLIRVRADASLVPFLHLHFYKDALTGAFAKAARGVGIHHLGARTLADWQIHLPPADEQRRIVDTAQSYFSRLDAVTATLERLHRNLKLYRASILNAAVKGRLVRTEAELAPTHSRDYEPASVLLTRVLAQRRRRWEEQELARMAAAGKTPRNDAWKAKYQEPNAPNTAALPTLPDGWCWATVHQLSQLLRSGCSRKPSPTGDVPILRISAVRPMALNPNDCRWLPGRAEDYPRDLVRPGDLLFTRYNGNPTFVGASALARIPSQPLVHPDKLIKVRLVDSDLDPSYLEIATNAGVARRFMVRRARTTAGQTGVSANDIKRLPIPLPPAREQRRISAAVADSLNIANNAAHTTARVVSQVHFLRHSFVEQAFHGKALPGL